MLNPCSGCTVIGTNGEINTDPPANGVYCINQDVTINASVGNLVVFNHSTFKIATGVKIIIPYNMRLRIDYAHLYSCEDMWKGIIVQQDPFGGMPGNPPSGGSLEIVNNAFIEDAEIVADITTPLNSMTGNTSVYIQNSIFNKNNVVISVSNYSYIATPSPNIGITGSIITSLDIPTGVYPSISTMRMTSSGIPFLQTQFLLGGYSQTPPNAFMKAPFLGKKPFAGIVLNNVGATFPNATNTNYGFTGLAIGAYGPPPVWTQNSYMNIFDNLSFGIYATNANFYFQNNLFQRLVIVNNVGAEGVRALATGGTNCKIANDIYPTVYSNWFYHCKTAISVQGYHSVILKRNNIRSSQSVNAPFSQYGQNGIYTLTHRYVDYDLSNNTMYNIKYGITFFANTGQVNIFNNNFTGQYAGMVKINSNDIRPVGGINPITTEYAERGITIDNSLPISAIPVFALTRGFDVKGNTLYRVRNGIYCHNMGYLPSFTAPPYLNIHQNFGDILVKPNSSTQDGITNIECRNNFLYNNLITGPPLNNNDKIRGIYTVSNNFQQVKCNYTRHTDIGILFKGNQSATVFRQNTMENHLKAYRLENFNATQGFIGQQGNSILPSDNQWIGTWTVGLNYMTSTDNSQANLSPLYVRNTPTFYPTLHEGIFSLGNNHPYSYPGALITVASPPELAGCPTSPDSICLGCPQLVYDEVENMETGIADAFYYDSLGITEEAFIAKDRLFRILRERPELRDSSVYLNTFYLSEQNGKLGKIVDLEQALATENWILAQALLQQFIPDNQVEQNYWNYYDLYLRYHTDSPGFNSDDSISVYNLALSCPFTEGSIVYSARSFYTILSQTNLVFEDICTPSGSRRVPTQSVIKVEIAPKPEISPAVSDGSVYLFIPQSTGNIQMNITDSKGTIVFTSTYSANGTLTPMHLPLQPGLYFVQFLNTENHESNVQKIVIR